MDATQEQWRPVVGFEGRYEISNHGRVRSLERVVNGGPTPTSTRRVPARIRAVAVDKSGHLHLILHKDAKRLQRTVHRLVAEAFIGPRPFPEAQIRHLNGIPTDNRVENLCYGTAQENAQDMLRHGTHSQASKTHCKWGHEFNLINTYIRPDGNRDCRPCAQARVDRRKSA